MLITISGMKNSSGWEYLIVLWSLWSEERCEQSLNVKEEELLDSFEWEDSDENDWLIVEGIVLGGFIIDGLFRGV